MSFSILHLIKLNLCHIRWTSNYNSLFYN